MRVTEIRLTYIVYVLEFLDCHEAPNILSV